jgi:OOP family OmpA-OmpF porin
MKLARTSCKMGVLALAVSAAPFAMAGDLGWYGGLSVGDARAKIDDPRITSGLVGTGLTTTSIEDRNRDTGYKLFGGYQFNRNFALEGGYFNLGKFGFTSITVPAGTLKGDIKLQGINLDAVGTLPFTEKFSGFGRVGVTYNEGVDSFSGTGAVNVLDSGPSKMDTNYKYGLGLQYDFTPTFAMRLEAERYRVNDAVGNRGDIDLVSVGLIVRFGRKTPEPAPYTPPPAPVAVAAPPAPVVVAPVPVLPPPAKALTRIAISVDSDFDFDKDNLNAGGKKVLDDFIKDVRGMKYDQIIVRGNTDRIGTEAYNMKLSVRRAETVRDYLIAGGIAAVKLDTSGVGKSQPETRLGECSNMKDRKALVNCLQPDRRVDIEVHGTR